MAFTEAAISLPKLSILAYDSKAGPCFFLLLSLGGIG